MSRRVSMPVVSVVLAAAALCLPAAAQNPAELAEKLAHLAQTAATLQTALPNFECTETVISRRARGEKDKWRVSFTAAITVKRMPDGKTDESFHVQTLEGKAFTQGSKFKLPVYVRGGFGGALNVFAADHQACFAYTLSPGRIDFKGFPATSSRPQCPHTEGMQGFALFDADGEMNHIEREVPSDYAEKYLLAPFSSVDLAPVTLNGRTYRLSSRLVSTWPDGKDTDHFESVYSGCHLFAATATILPATTVITGDTPDPTPK